MPQLNRIFACLLALACVTMAKSPTAAIFPLSARGVDSNSTRILEDALADALAKTGKIRLLERSQMSSILKEQGFQKSGACEAEQCAVQMGKLLGIEQGVIGSIGLLGKTWVLNARTIDIGTGEVLKTTQRSLSGEIDKVLTDLIPATARDLTNTTGTSDKQTSSPSSTEVKSSSSWLWWTLGGVAVAGGAAAAVILATGSKSPAASNPGTDNGGTSESGALDFTWIPAGN